MSNFFAIATVTAAIVNVLQAIKQDVAGATITAKPLDVSNSEAPSNRLNVFLYRITPNIGYRNANLPTYNQGGELVRSPLISIDLHYLLTAYGAQNDDLMAHQILASAMRIMEENAILTKKVIRDTVATVSKLTFGDRSSDLADQIENIRLSFSNISIEELSNIWSSSQTNYRLSATYQASVVLLESVSQPKIAPVVRDRMLYVLPITESFIESIEPQIVEYGPKAKIRIIGRNLKADAVRVYIDNISFAPREQDTVNPDRISMKIPEGLPVGLRQVRVVQPMMMGLPPKEHETAFSSNTVPFILCPSIVSLSPQKIMPGNDLTVRFLPPAKPADDVSILIGNKIISVPKRLENTPPIQEVTVKIPEDTKPDRYIVRIRINNTDSLTKQDDNPDSQTYGQFVLPAVEVKSQ